MIKKRGRVVGLDVHPDSFAGRWWKELIRLARGC